MLLEKIERMNTALIIAFVAQLVSTVVGQTPSPTTAVTPWLVGEGTFVVVGDDIFTGSLQVSHNIGGLVNASYAEAVIVELLDPSCTTELNSTGSVIGLNTTGYSGSPFVYDVNVEETLIASDPNFVFIDTADPLTGNSKGSLKFCTRVTTVEGPVQVAFRETIFELIFDLTDNDITLNNIVVGNNVIDSFVTLVETDFQIATCLCDSSGACVANPDPIGATDPLKICLEPTTTAKNLPVHISNLNLQLATPTFTYEPVAFGSEAPEGDAITSLNNFGDTVQVTTMVVAQFFIQGAPELEAGGNCFLEFDSSKQQLPMFVGYGMNIVLAVEAPQMGCLQKVVDRVKNMFKTPLGDGVGGAISGVVDGVEGTVSGVVDGVEGAVSGAVDGVEGAVSGAVESASGIFDGIQTQGILNFRSSP
jgi:hypothetical protein